MSFYSIQEPKTILFTPPKSVSNKQGKRTQNLSVQVRLKKYAGRTVWMPDITEQTKNYFEL